MDVQTEEREPQWTIFSPRHRADVSGALIGVCVDRKRFGEVESVVGRAVLFVRNFEVPARSDYLDGSSCSRVILTTVVNVSVYRRLTLPHRKARAVDHVRKYRATTPRYTLRSKVGFPSMRVRFSSN